MKFFTRLTIINTIFLCSLLFAQQYEKYDQSISEDIRIMESILEQLISSVGSSSTYQVDISGSYFSDRGYVFFVSPRFYAYDIHSLSVLQKRLTVLDSVLKQNGRKPKSIQGFLQTLDSSKLEEMRTIFVQHNDYLEKKLSQYEEKIYTFFQNYADVTNRLKPGQKVILLLFPMSNSDNALSVEYWISKENINRYRKNEISKEEFNKKIEKKRLTSPSFKESFQIMSAILEQMISNYSRQELLLKRNINGIFIPDMGVLFLLNVQELSVNFTKNRFEKPVKLFRKLIQTVGDYGRAFHSLPQNSSFYMMLKIRSISSEEHTYLIRLLPIDLKAYARSQISLDTLLQRTHIVEVD